MTIFQRVKASPNEKLKADEGANHPQKPPNGQHWVLVFAVGLLLTPVVAILSGYNVTTSAEVTLGKLWWSFEGKPALPPSQQP